MYVCVYKYQYKYIIRNTITIDIHHVNRTMVLTHLKAGAQKNIVLGPAGWSHKGRNFRGTIRSPIETADRYKNDILFLLFVRFYVLLTKILNEVK